PPEAVHSTSSPSPAGVTFAAHLPGPAPPLPVSPGAVSPPALVRVGAVRLPRRVCCPLSEGWFSPARRFSGPVAVLSRRPPYSGGDAYRFRAGRPAGAARSPGLR